MDDKMKALIDDALRPGRRVLSYTRFSTKRQAKGDSHRRQTEMAIKWCIEEKHELDTSLTLHDEGMSAYTGENATRGALGALQRMTLDGKLEKGTILLVEAFDRLTRLPLSDAYEMLLSLINNGITIVTLTDGKVWIKATMNSMESFMLSLVTLYRGYQESSQKADRLQKVFAAARKTGRQSAFGSAPGWLYREDRGPWQIDQEKAESVRKVFEKAAAGFGSKAIAKFANQEGWPVPTRLNKTGRWHGQMPGNILRSRSVLGEHEHRIHTHEAVESEGWRGKSSGIKKTDYYPRIIQDALWKRAQASILTRMVNKRRDIHYYNVFAGLMYCGACGAPIHRKNERTGYSRAQLNCSGALAGVTECKTMSAACADPMLLTAIFKHAPISVSTRKGEKLLKRQAELSRRIAEKEQESEHLAAAIARGISLDSIMNKLEGIEFDLRMLHMEFQMNLVSEALANMGEVGVVEVDKAMENLYLPDDEDAREYRLSLHMKLSRLVETIWIWAYDVALVRFQNSDKLHVVELLHKQLPSRANPSAKYHKKPRPKEPPEKPYLEAAREGVLEPALPRRVEKQKKECEPLDAAAS
ncbi:recombinase family protein [Janthinobacterium sp. SUN176]|uniref:recombinase family protein n=1 Tax=Janthinobacterium sp. SUN176 TaxID=3014788 RepID=UPI00271371C6|nr:recombinase family protein [Janthinobacterium sp. SUN176]MDO8072839.1 recombinase family protein [Janthinobacterium sp. SUN176]